ncbi:MAG: heavy-metal-associated domain-containing protein [Opitutae bacterium]|nr:heavy-metal-associated domain-containing protein [Opitutae bacterium]
MKLIPPSVVFGILLASFSQVLANDDKDKKEATPEARLQAAEFELTKHSQIALIYVKGLVCPSCGIGVSKNLSRMHGVDKERFKRGIEMDTKTQLVKIALSDQSKLDKKEVLERVDDAGFDAIEEYKLHDDHIDAHKFEPGTSEVVVHHTKK